MSVGAGHRRGVSVYSDDDQYLLAYGSDAPLPPGVEDLVDDRFRRVLQRTVIDKMIAADNSVLCTFKWRCSHRRTQAGVRPKCHVVINPATMTGTATCGRTYQYDHSGVNWFRPDLSFPAGLIYRRAV